MNTSLLIENAQWLANRLKIYFSKSSQDIHSETDWRQYRQNLKFKNGNIDIILKPVPDSGRSSDPLEFGSKTTWCFCQDDTSSKNRKLLSSFMLKNKGKGILYSMKCGPEPQEEHFIDLCLLAQSFKGVEAILTVNLPGSGASLPQHYHTQIWPKRDSWRNWLNNFKSFENKFTSIDFIEVKEFRRPIWGLEIKFPKDSTAFQIGKRLFQITQQIRLDAQLKLAYNLYIDSKKPNVIKVIYRESWKESPFNTPEVHKIILESTDEETADKITSSDNAKWRWGWSECIGGLPARDDSFFNDERFNVEFWKKIFQFMTFDSKYQKPLLQRVKSILSKPEPMKEYFNGAQLAGALEEWKSLREEIARKQNYAHQIFISLTGANFAIYAFLSQQVSSEGKITPIHLIVCLFPIILTVIAYYLNLLHEHSSRRIAHYIKFKIESISDIGIKWESWLSKKRNNSKSQVSKLWQFAFRFNFILAFLILLSFTIAYLMQGDSLPYGWIMLFFGIFILILFLIYGYTIRKRIENINEIGNENLL